LLDRWVLTAAHCVVMKRPDGSSFTLQPGQFKIFGGSNLQRKGEGDLIDVAGIYPHPGYDNTQFDNDIALVRLARAPQRGKWATIKIPTADFDIQLGQEGVPTIVTGWGRTETGKSPVDLREARI